MADRIRAAIPTCPYCGGEDHDWLDGDEWWNAKEKTYNLDPKIIKCTDCNRKFEVELELEANFYMKRIEGEIKSTY